MRKPEQTLIEEWRQVAHKDWRRTGRNLEEGDLEAAGFFLQQSIEKFLKAFLLQHGWHLKKTHVLHALLDDALGYKPELERFRPLCERVSGYYLLDRYPPLFPSELIRAEVEQDLEEAKQLIKELFPDEDL